MTFIRWTSHFITAFLLSFALATALIDLVGSIEILQYPIVILTRIVSILITLFVFLAVLVVLNKAFFGKWQVCVSV